MVIGQRINTSSAAFIQDDILNDLVQEKNQEKRKPTTDNSKNLRSVLLRADLGCRLVVGLAASIKQLSVEPDDSLFCVLIPKKGDSAQHMQEVLLRAFCFEHDIYVVQVDSAQKLSRLLNRPCDTCVLVQRSTVGNCASEEALIDFCEDHWDDPIAPVVQLPES